ncbi:MAG: nucleoside deaminase [Pseudomonadota bacterium]
MPAKASFMMQAYEEAVEAGKRGEVPVGAVIVHNGEVIGADGNRTLELRDPTAHAEILAIRHATKFLNSERIEDCDLYVTLEPCTMCAGAISFSRIRRLYYGATDLKSGGVENGARFFTQATCHHVPEIYSGIMETECSTLLRDFFKQRRN